MSDLQKYLEKSLKDEEFKKEWDKLEFRYAVISRIENGTVNIGIDFIDKLAKAFNKRVEINLV